VCDADSAEAVSMCVRCRASVIAEANSRDVMYDHGYMKPYIFFDVSTGRESRQGTGSLRNQVSLSRLYRHTLLHTHLGIRGMLISLGWPAN